jgi:F0F1-type ATP synthase epsilon subunit
MLSNRDILDFLLVTTKKCSKMASSILTKTDLDESKKAKEKKKHDNVNADTSTYSGRHIQFNLIY